MADLELNESFLKWKHDSKYTIYGKSIISGDTQIGLHFDTNSYKYCALHSTIKYIDENSNKVVISNFGTFEPKITKPRIARNPKTNEKVPVSSKKTIKFKISKNL